MSQNHPATAGSSFSEAEVLRFQKDDLTAGKFIGRTLVLIFLYSAVVMGGVIWWTYTSIDERSESSTQPTVASESE